MLYKRIYSSKLDNYQHLLITLKWLKTTPKSLKMDFTKLIIKESES